MVGLGHLDPHLVVIGNLIILYKINFKIFYFIIIIDMDVNKLMYALDNENNEGIINLTSKKILEMNLNIIKELHLDKPTTLNYLKNVLPRYRYKSDLVTTRVFLLWLFSFYKILIILFFLSWGCCAGFRTFGAIFRTLLLTTFNTCSV